MLLGSLIFEIRTAGPEDTTGVVCLSFEIKSGVLRRNRSLMGLEPCVVSPEVPGVSSSIHFDGPAADFRFLSCFGAATISIDDCLSFSGVSSLSFPFLIIPFKYRTSSANTTIINKK